MFAVRIIGALLIAEVALAAADAVRIAHEDLPQYGLLLIPPSSPEYAGLLADIEQRIAHPVAGTPSYPAGFAPKIPVQDRELSAILVNRSKKTISSAVMVWRTQGSTLSLGLGAGPTVLEPWDVPPELLTRIAYWHVILPGSKRYIGGRMSVGDNSDVRPPTPAEMGGTDLAGEGQTLFGGGALASVTMTLDGVFFTDGEFVGPDQAKLWERTVSDAEEHTRIAKMARDGHDDGETPTQIFADIAAVTAPAEQRFPGYHGLGMRNSEATMDDFRLWRLSRIAFSIARSRKLDGDDATLSRLMKWADAKLPQFHRQ